MKPEFILLKGGRILDPASNTDKVQDLLIHNGIIEQMGPLDQRALSKQGEMVVFDLAGKWVTPGLIDMHVHLRDPGRPDKETIESGSRAAARGGFTAILAMPNTAPPIDNPGMVHYVVQEAKRKAAVHVLPAACITKGQQGKQITEMGLLQAAGAVAVTDDGHEVMNSGVMRRAIEYARGLGLPLIDHCEDITLAAGGAMNESAISTQLGLQGIPVQAESVMVARNIELARHFGPVHLAHISTQASVDLIRYAKAEGIPITAEVTPHHLALNESAITHYNTHAKMNPPLRSERDVAAVMAALLDGTIDCIASDHAPHTSEEKQAEFALAPVGVIGLETSVPVLMKTFIETDRWTPLKLIAALTTAPAKILKLNKGVLAVGGAADITVIDPEKTDTINPDAFESKSRNTPFAGWSGKGFPVMTIVSGTIVYQDTSLHSKNPALNHA